MSKPMTQTDREYAAFCNKHKLCPRCLRPSVKGRVLCKRHTPKLTTRK